MGTVPIWKHWLIIAAGVLASPIIVFALACARGCLPVSLVMAAEAGAWEAADGTAQPP